jgi:hypothetical protein
MAPPFTGTRVRRRSSDEVFPYVAHSPPDDSPEPIRDAGRRRRASGLDSAAGLGAALWRPELFILEFVAAGGGRGNLTKFDRGSKALKMPGKSV